MSIANAIETSKAALPVGEITTVKGPVEGAIYAISVNSPLRLLKICGDCLAKPREGEEMT